MNTSRATLFFILILSTLFLAACEPTGAPEATAVPVTAAIADNSADEELAAEPSPANTPVPTAESPALPTETAVAPAAPTLEPLPPDPQWIEFESEDGTPLVGVYYPAATNPAPIVVLMHWAGGDKNDWRFVGMASWLQNRGIEIPAPIAPAPFDTPYPFPPLPADQSYGVFIFDFRTFGESGGSDEGDLGQLWIADARAAYATALALPGVDPAQMAGIGASIGSDAVVDGCIAECLGALSLGPGSYLDMPYDEATAALDALGKPVWCVGAEDDEASVDTCNSASGDLYHTVIYPEGGHAMRLFRVENDLQPPIEAVLLDFLGVVFGGN